MRIEEAGRLFFTYLQHERGCSAATCTAYHSDLAGLLRYLEQESVEAEVERLTPQFLRRYVSWLSSSGYSPATTARRLYAVSSLFKYLVNYGYAQGNPCGQIVLPKKQKRMPAVLTVEEARNGGSDHILTIEDLKIGDLAAINEASVILSTTDEPSTAKKPSVDPEYGDMSALQDVIRGGVSLDLQ